MNKLLKFTLLALAVNGSAQAQDVFSNVESFNQNELNIIIDEDSLIQPDISYWLQDPETDNFIAENGDTYWYQGIPPKEYRKTDELFMNCRKHRCVFAPMEKGTELERYNKLKQGEGIPMGQLLKK